VLSAGVELVINERLLIRLAAEATQLNLSFAGNGMLATSRDGDPSTVDVRGAIDRYYGGVATAAVTYGSPPVAPTPGALTSGRSR
jgi:hypothetical protein